MPPTKTATPKIFVALIALFAALPLVSQPLRLVPPTLVDEGARSSPVSSIRLEAVPREPLVFKAVGPWTVIPLSNDSWNINAVTWTGSEFWAVGGTRVLTSEHGTSWSLARESSLLNLLDVHHASDFSIAVGTRYALFLPSDALFDFGDGTVLSGVTEVSGRWVVAGGFFNGSSWLDTLYFSDDQGATWTLRTTGSEDYLLAVAGDVVSELPAFVAVGIDGRVLTSTDGSSWVARVSGTPFNLQDVAHGGGVWVAVGSGGTILRSINDGASWSDVSLGGGTLASVHYADGHFVTTGQDGRIFSSSDGSTWTAEVSGTSDFLEGLTYGNSTWIAGGDSGEVVKTTPAFGVTPPGDGPGGDSVPPTLLDASKRASIDYSDDDYADDSQGLGTGGPSQELVSFAATNSGISGLGDGSGLDVLQLQWTFSTDRVGWRTAEVGFRYETPTDISEAQETLLKLYQAPALDGPWTLVPEQYLDPQANEISGTVNRLGHFALTIARDPVCSGAVAYVENFEAATSTDPAALGFSVENLAGGGVIPAFATWLVANDPTLDPVFIDGFESLNPTTYAIQFGDVVTPNDDWLISPEFDLESSATYVVQFRHEAGPGLSDLDAILGVGEDSASLSAMPPIVEIVDASASSSLYQTYFTPTESAAHRLAFHEVSSPPSSSFYSLVDDLAVVEFSLPDSTPPALDLVTSSIEVAVGDPAVLVTLGTVSETDYPLSSLEVTVSGLPSILDAEITFSGASLDAQVSAGSELPLGSYSALLRIVDPCGGVAESSLSLEVIESQALFADGFESGDLTAWDS